MAKKLLLQALAQYEKSSLALPEEAETIKRFVRFVQETPDCFGRPAGGHVTSSAWIVDHTGTKALLTHHRKLNRWLQLGGHNDGDSDCAAVAVKEGWEESGIEGLKLFKPEIFDIDIHPLPNACAFHYDVRYILQAPEGAKYVISDESHDLAWVPVREVQNFSKQRSVLRMQEKWLDLF